MVPGMDKHANERKRPVYAGDITNEEAEQILKEEGIWQRLTDGKHKLKFFCDGFTEIQTLKLSRKTLRLATTSTDYDYRGDGSAMFALKSLDGKFNKDYGEFTEEFAALRALFEE